MKQVHGMCSTQHTHFAKCIDRDLISKYHVLVFLNAIFLSFLGKDDRQEKVVSYEDT